MQSALAKSKVQELFGAVTGSLPGSAGAGPSGGGQEAGAKGEPGKGEAPAADVVDLGVVVGRKVRLHWAQCQRAAGLHYCEVADTARACVCAASFGAAL